MKILGGEISRVGGFDGPIGAKGRYTGSQPVEAVDHMALILVPGQVEAIAR